MNYFMLLFTRGGMILVFGVIIAFLAVCYGISALIKKMRGGSAEDEPDEQKETAAEVMLRGTSVYEPPKSRIDDDELEHSLLEKACRGEGVGPKFARNMARQDREMVKERIRERDEK